MGKKEYGLQQNVKDKLSLIEGSENISILSSNELESIQLMPKVIIKWTTINGMYQSIWAIFATLT